MFLITVTKIQGKTPAQSRLEAIRKEISDVNKAVELKESSEIVPSKTDAKKAQPNKRDSKKLHDSSHATSLLTNVKITKIIPSAMATGDAKSSAVTNLIQESTKTETIFKIPKVPKPKLETSICNLPANFDDSSNYEFNRKRKFDDGFHQSSGVKKSSSSLTNRLIKIQEECRAKNSKENNNSTNITNTDSITNVPLLQNAENLSEQELSEIRAKLIFQLKSDESFNQDQLSDDDVSMKTESLSTSSSSCEGLCNNC